ncbi:MAG: hypothetical protein KAS32_27425 [Candidatus Peribacteraceae bacterium]|nr:hypothetical protein [Candidatus Peribacteraceae bacterium]
MADVGKHTAIKELATIGIQAETSGSLGPGSLLLKAVKIFIMGVDERIIYNCLEF